MATHVSDGIAKGNPPALLNPVQHGGHLKLNVCKVKLAAASVADDIVELCRLPAGTKLVTRLCYALGGGTGAKVELVGYTAAQDYGTFAPTKNDEALVTSETVLKAKLTGTAVAKDTELVFGIVYAGH